ncbi:MAG: hypothetical protein J2P43_08935 [Candidatus Dormibacteraeota bacterium]|nr:hypothetical protein [Candidatus Dormibacteraeota bacterium]
MSSYPRSADGAWYWDGRRWVAAGAAPASPLPSSLGRSGGSHWDGSELFVRCGRGAMVFSTVLMGFAVVLDVGVLILLAGLAGESSPGGLATVAVFLGLMGLGDVVLIGCWLYFLRWSIRPPSIRFSDRGILARQPWRGSFSIPWDAVVQVGTHRGTRLFLTVEVSENFWRHLGRRWTPRWAAPFAFGGPPRAAGMVALPPGGTGMEMEDILRCLRQLAPARIPVTQGLATPRSVGAG